jgi:hypothetical protein
MFVLSESCMRILYKAETILFATAVPELGEEKSG